MSDYFNIENDNTDRVLPYNYRPGTDLISKMVLTDNQGMNMLIKVLVPEVAEDHYVAISMEFINKNKCDVFYAPHDPLSAFPPVFIEVDEKFFVRAVHYINEHKADEELHPLQALGDFVCSQSLSMSTLDYGKNDEWVKLLYSIAHDNFKQLSGEENEKLRCLENGDKASIEKALSYVDDALGFLQRQKRKYCEAIETTPIEEAPPLVYLNKNRKLTSSVDLNDERNKTELYQFVQRFKSIESGRIN
ncbi:hypothetical protein G6F62_008531 [Rhizopus arrhizus]|uniref:Uncharacterized protein n=1 Tax=Rhizopus oryzae TaxID=64495 RepID=A0A9P7BTG9_RHIOR|nr:hypothetical protein G6F23_011440 [Rhizopus arrhizus]KAG0754274.1 hypothetical protein G6F24_012532 [Rhizopus arrhizus]KAG0912839.1 hypothetical protein G6F33_005722 [Rhizopus arrhizus]KAG1295584.1 hypothetical protein G6F66_004210 [Rhizopus arrhizus]KAG1309801.1 hypothetical protein G6F64_005032 [Rhizopus arrhizus]